MSYKFSKLSSAIKYVIAAGLIATPVAAMTPEEADFNDDGVVNFSDIYEILTRYGVMRGEPAYREHLDTNSDGVLDFNDYLPIFPMFYQSASTTGTTFSGIVTNEDEEGLGSILVQLGANSLTTCTNPDGTYSIDVTEPELLGDTEVNFFGTEDVNNTCPGLDPDPGATQYPTIPHKPVFVNGGTDVMFRQLALIGRDLTGSETVPETDLLGDPAPGEPREYELAAETEVSNSGVSINVGQGCNVTFPGGEPATISITRVDPGDLPVTQPPGINSSLWVTFQPGGTVIDDCPAGTKVVIEVDNVDGATNTENPVDESDPDQPQLYEVIDGAFQPIAPMTVLNADGSVSDPGVAGPKMMGMLDVTLLGSFGFAWYGVATPVNPCPTTDLFGRVLRDDAAMDPIANALVSVPGIGQVNTNALGEFTLFNVPAHPNNANCFFNPFVYIATAQKDLDNPPDGIQGNEIGLSLPTPAVSGGITDMGDIKIGDVDNVGTVKGDVRKLNSIDPWVHIPLPLAEMSLFANGQPVPPAPLLTDPLGNFQFDDVPVGFFPNTLQLDMIFDGLLPPPGGGQPQPKFFSDSKTGNVDFAGQVLNIDFRELGHGEVIVNVVDEFGDPINNVNVGIFFPDVFFEPGRGILRDINGYTGPASSCFLFTGEEGVDGIESGEPGRVFFNQNNCGSTIPMGACEIEVFSFFGGEFGYGGSAFLGPDDGCFINQHGETLELTIELIQPPIPGDIDRVIFGQAAVQIEPGPPPVLQDVLEMRILFTEPFEEFTDPYVEIHFDMDRDPNTGFEVIPFDSRGGGSPDSNAVNNVISNNPGADVRILCNTQLLDFYVGVYGGSNAGLIGPGMCEGIDENGDVIPGLGRAEMDGPFSFDFDDAGPQLPELVLLIPKQPLVDFADSMPGGPFGNSDWDTVVETGIETFGYGGLTAEQGTLGFDSGENTDIRRARRVARPDLYGEGDIVFDVVPNIDEFDNDPPFDPIPPAPVDPDGETIINDELDDWMCYFGFCGFFGKGVNI